MGILKNLVPVLVAVLLSVVLWVGSIVYLGYSSVELRGEILGSENVYQFLSKGMLSEVKVTTEKTEQLPEGVSVDLLEPIEGHFSKIGFEKVVEKTKNNLMVAPEEFHKLQNDAVIKTREPN